MIAGGAGAFLVMKALSGPSDSAPRASEAPEGGGEASLGEASPHGSAPSGEEEPIKAPSKSGGSSAASGGGHGGGGEAAAGAEGAAPAGPVTVKLDPFQTNLNSSGGRAYIKLTMSFEVDGQEGADQLTAQMDSVRDVIITFLMSVSADDISTPDGMVRLKSQIQSRVNNILTDHKVRKVNITDIAVQ
jgi:flagellar basal body-associated protein FliL